MSNIKMNLFEHYTQNGCIPIENNISRILARILNDNIYIFNSFINKINEKCKVSLGVVETEYSVDFQRNVSDIDIDYYNHIIGVALTAEELQETENIDAETNKNLITDIIIEHFKDTLIIIEVKRTNENCMYQLDKQIQSIINDKDIKYEKVSMKWEDIVEILGNYIKLSKQQDIVVEDYYNYLKHYYKKWFPVTSLDKCDSQEFIDNRIETLLQNIQNISNNELEVDKKWVKVKEWGWTKHIDVSAENEYLYLKMWPGDSGQQFYNLIPKTSLKFVIEPINYLELKVRNAIIKVESNVKPYLKVSDAFAGWIVSGDLDKQFYKEKADYTNIFSNLHGKWNRNDGNKNFIRDNRNFLDEIDSIKLLNKEYFIDRVQHILNNTNRTQIIISLGFYVEFKISMEELKKVDVNFNSKNDIDELAKPLYDLIMQCKNIIEQ